MILSVPCSKPLKRVQIVLDMYIGKMDDLNTHGCREGQWQEESEKACQRCCCQRHTYAIHVTYIYTCYYIQGKGVRGQVR